MQTSVLSDKTVTRSFRISEFDFKALEEGSVRHDISLNTLVNQIFSSYANFDQLFERMGYVKVSKMDFRNILELVSDKDVAEVARRSTEDSAEALILAKYGTLSLTTVLEMVKTWLRYSNYAEYSEVQSPEGKRIITLNHNNRMKLSIYLSQCVSSCFELMDIHPKITLTDQAVVLEF